MATRGWMLVGLAGLVVLFFAGTQAWVTGHVPTVAVGVVEIEAPGTEVSQLVTAAALLAGAGLLGGLIGSRPVRLLAGLVLIGGGVLAGAAVLDTVLDPAGAVAQIIAERTGVSGGGIDPNHTLEASAWPWAALTGAVCLLGAGVLRWWSPLSAADRNRQQRTAGPPAAPAGAGTDGDAVIDEVSRQDVGDAAMERDRALDDWQELSEGRDPTQSEQ